MVSVPVSKCDSSALRVPSPHLRAVQYIRRMRGGAQAHLVRCSDDNYYVIKVVNNPQGSRILATELLGARLAKLLGLPVAEGAIVMVSQSLIALSEEMVVEMPCSRIPCEAGACFGSRCPVDPRRAPLFDSLPAALLRDVENLQDFLGMLVFDLWTCNREGRQVVFFRDDERPQYRAVMIDQGFSFSASEWNFPDSPVCGLYRGSKGVYANVRGIESFEPWLSRLESEIDENVLAAAAAAIPPEWYESDTVSLHGLVASLNERRTRVRELLGVVRSSYPSLFPKWVCAIGATAG